MPSSAWSDSCARFRPQERRLARNLRISQLRCRYAPKHFGKGGLEITRHVAIARPCVRDFVQERTCELFNAGKLLSKNDDAIGRSIPKPLRRVPGHDVGAHRLRNLDVFHVLWNSPDQTANFLLHRKDL